VLQKSAIFIDRDGVINKKMPEGRYVEQWSEFCFLPGIFEAFRILSESAFLIIIVTNQRCIAKGIITEEKLREIHESMAREIKNEGGNIDAIYFCPHDISDDCSCRKPKPGMLLLAKDDFKNKGIEIDVKNSYIIGDDEKDILAGKLVGLKTIKIGKYLETADMVKEDFREAVYAILEREKRWINSDIIENVKKDTIRILNKYLGDNYLLIVFGSFVRNEVVRSSDIDLAVYRNEKIPVRIIAEAKEELSEKVHTLRDIDLINLTGDVNMDLLKNILEEGVVWQKTKNFKGLLRNLKKRLANTEK